MWITKFLISPVKIRFFCPKKSKFGPKMAFLFFMGQFLPAHLVGGCGARAVSHKTPIYFMIMVEICLILILINDDVVANFNNAGNAN